MARFTEWLFRITPADTDPAPEIRLPERVHHVPPPHPDSVDDTCETELEQPDEDGKIDLDPVYCVIDYRDAKGNQTRRRITLIRASQGRNAAILTAICHERRALRHFRCDRISCFIEPDGEVIDTKVFFLETLAIDITALAEPPDEATQIANEIREYLRAPLSILVAAARCDGDFHPEELDEICRYVERELLHGPAAKRFPNITVDVLDNLTPMIRMMRPRRSSVPGYLRKVSQFSRRRFDLFARTLQCLVLADGRLDGNEIEFIEEMTAIHTGSGNA